MIPVPLLVVLAAAPASPSPGPDDTGDVGTAGPTGLALTVVLLIAVALLVRSMSKHLKRIPRSFDPEDDVRPADVPPVPDTPAELLGDREPGQDLLDQLRRAPRAIEPPRPPRDDRPEDAGS